MMWEVGVAATTEWETRKSQEERDWAGGRLRVVWVVGGGPE